MSSIWECISHAKRDIAEDGDAFMAAFVLRDRQEVKDAGLDGLAWATYQGNPHANDVYYLIELLEKHVGAQP